MNKKPNPRQAKVRSLLVELPVSLADALDLMKVHRQQAVGQTVSKKQLVIEAIERLVAATK